MDLRLPRGLRDRPVRAVVLVLVVLAAAWRLWLMSRYAGWEESDYGNLAMARGVLASGFTRFDMNHLPLYYGLSAAVMAVVGDAVVATRAVSLAGGLVAMGLAVGLAGGLAGPRAAWLAGLLLLVQPEFALYSASSLREPVYTAFLLGALVLAIRERPGWAAVALSGAFLVRFDALLVGGAALLVHVLGRGPRLRRLAALALPLAATVALWSLYCAEVHGTWRFWEHSISVNLDTGLGAEATTPAGWARNGLGVVGGLFLGVLPGHLGHVLVLGALLAVPRCLRAGHGPSRTTALLALAATGFWLLLGFTGQHEPGHNLYWKWLFPLVPLWAVLAALTLDRVHGGLARLLGPAGAGVVTALLVGTTLGTQVRETERQVTLSDALYRPQRELARRIEAEIPEDEVMILDNIPGCWLNRRDHARRLWTWMDVPDPAGDRAAFAAWLQREGIRRVLWFREEWTRAPAVAPWLGAGGVVRLPGVDLHEEAREDAYGWIWYRVEAGIGPEDAEAVDGPLPPGYLPGALGQ